MSKPTASPTRRSTRPVTSKKTAPTVPSAPTAPPGFVLVPISVDAYRLARALAVIDQMDVDAWIENCICADGSGDYIDSIADDLRKRIDERCAE